MYNEMLYDAGILLCRFLRVTVVPTVSIAPLAGGCSTHAPPEEEEEEEVGMGTVCCACDAYNTPSLAADCKLAAMGEMDREMDSLSGMC